MVNILKKISVWLKPKCDICGHIGTDKNPLISDGIGIKAHERCWR